MINGGVIIAYKAIVPGDAGMVHNLNVKNNDKEAAYIIHQD
jgi:hypothetical protein